MSYWQGFPGDDQLTDEPVRKSRGDYFRGHVGASGGIGVFVSPLLNRTMAPLRSASMVGRTA